MPPVASNLENELMRFAEVRMIHLLRVAMLQFLFACTGDDNASSACASGHESASSSVASYRSLEHVWRAGPGVAAA